MATIKSIEIMRNFGKRPTSDNVIIQSNNYIGIEKGQEYDLVKFSINELNKPYFWNETLCVPTGTSEDVAMKLASEFAANITEQSIKEYQNFLNDGEKWGWD